MKKVLFIVLALLVVGCSKNNPVAPVQNIYNSSGDLYLVEYKNHPPILDSMGFYNGHSCVGYHIDISIDPPLDSFSIITLPSAIDVVVSNNRSIVCYVDYISFSDTNYMYYFPPPSYVNGHIYQNFSMLSLQSRFLSDNVTIDSSTASSDYIIMKKYMTDIISKSWMTFIIKRATILQ